MADHPLRPATDHRLGRPLPHQPANRPQVPRAPIRRSFLTNPTRSASVSGITHRFRWLPPCARQLPHAFLTRPPRERPEGRPVRLACIRHAASVDPEPGSNSPPMCACLRSLPCHRSPPAPGTGPLCSHLVWLGSLALPRSSPTATSPLRDRDRQAAPTDRKRLLRLPHTTSVACHLSRCYRRSAGSRSLPSAEEEF